MADHEQRLRPDRPGHVDRHLSQPGPSVRAVAHRHAEALDRLRKLEKLKPEEIERRSVDRLRIAREAANLRSKGR